VSRHRFLDRRSDRGSATVWVLGLAAVILAVAMAAVLRGTAVLARHRLERAADLAALAAAERIGQAGQPCAAASRIATANGAALASCTTRLDPSGRSGTVAITVQRTVSFAMVGTRTLTARSRAGRAPPDSVSDGTGTTDPAGKRRQ
jgi:secretion/DNA translocation related TadE-like protein